MTYWQGLHRAKLNTQRLYALPQLRCAVSVAEQQCPYQGVGDDDLVGENRHILGWHNDELVAYARTLKSGDELEPVVIGRAIASEALRGEKLEQQLMAQTLVSYAQHQPHKASYLGAQAHLQLFYVRFGFILVTDIYDENGTPCVRVAQEAHQAQTDATSPGCPQLAGTSIGRENITSLHSYESRIDDDPELLSETLKEVLRSSDDPANQKYFELRTQAERALEEVRNHVSHTSDSYYYHAKKAACRADDYVHEESWRGISANTAAGLVTGLLLMR